MCPYIIIIAGCPLLRGFEVYGGTIETFTVMSQASTIEYIGPLNGELGAIIIT